MGLSLGPIPTNTGDPMIDLAGQEALLSQSMGNMLEVQKSWLEARTAIVSAVQALSTRLTNMMPTFQPGTTTAANGQTMINLGTNATDSANIIATLQSYGITINPADASIITKPGGTGAWQISQTTLNSWITGVNGYMDTLNTKTQEDQTNISQTMQSFTSAIDDASNQVKSVDTSDKGILQNVR